MTEDLVAQVINRSSYFLKHLENKKKAITNQKLGLQFEELGQNLIFCTLVL
jgi:hypothetical protein